MREEEYLLPKGALYDTSFMDEDIEPDDSDDFIDGDDIYEEEDDLFFPYEEDDDFYDESYD